MARTASARYELLITAPVNGEIGKTTFRFLDSEGKTAHIDKADVQSERARDRVVRIRSVLPGAFGQ